MDEITEKIKQNLPTGWAVERTPLAFSQKTFKNLDFSQVECSIVVTPPSDKYNGRITILFIYKKGPIFQYNMILVDQRNYLFDDMECLFHCDLEDLITRGGIERIIYHVERKLNF